MIRTESEFKKQISLLSDKKIKEMVEQIDIHHYPVLLLKEYSHRFGPHKYSERTNSKISKKLLDAKMARRRAANMLKEELRKLNEFNLSQVGLDSISQNSIDSLHQKTNSVILEIKKLITKIENSSKNIIALEKLYKETYS